MIAIVTLLVAFPVGYFFRSRLAANTVYAVAYLWAFIFQSVYLLLSVGQPEAAFTSGDFPWDYGLVTAAVFGAGFALVAAGQWARSRRGAAASAVQEA